MQKKQAILLYLKQYVSQNGTISGECYQLTKSGGVTDRELRDVLRLSLEMYDKRMKAYPERKAA